MREIKMHVGPHPSRACGRRASHLPRRGRLWRTDCPLVGVDALIDPNQNITARSRDDVGIVPYGVLSEALGHLRGIVTGGNPWKGPHQ